MEKRGQEVKSDGETALTHSVEKKRKEKKVHILFLKNLLETT